MLLAGEDARLARPPFLMRNHQPCMNTDSYTAPALLQHLQTLSWYNGQVGHM